MRLPILATGFLTSVWVTKGTNYGEEHGYSLDSAGDVNGDGFDDVIIGGPGYTNDEESEGRASIYYGSATGLRSTPDLIIESHDDFAYSGAGVAGAGDVNGDGYADVVIGACGYTNGETNEGRASLFLGSAVGLVSKPGSWVAESNQAEAKFGLTVAGHGDVNGDGFDDVAVGAPFMDGEFVDQGAAFVFLGSATEGLEATAAWSASLGTADASFGGALSIAGDVNGDGFDDLLVGAPGEDDGAGMAYLFLGSASGLATEPAWCAAGVRDSAFGVSVASAGDVNGDGFDDVLVGAPSGAAGALYSAGSASLFLGSATGPDATPTWVFTGDSSRTFLGRGVAIPGDLNADGFDDVAVGAASWDHGTDSYYSVLVFFGSPTGLGGCDVAFGDKFWFTFGYEMASAGDVDRDGDDDLLVGAPFQTTNWGYDGTAYLFTGAAFVPSDADGDGTGDLCDRCPGYDDHVDEDGDLIPDRCDACPQQSDVFYGVDGDGDGICHADCDDSDPTVYPGALELCDGKNNSCSTLPVDEYDWDDDGVFVCNGDCDDLDDRRHPGATEICNAIDDDCDGVADDTCHESVDDVTGSRRACGCAGTSGGGWLTGLIALLTGRRRSMRSRASGS